MRQFSKIQNNSTLLRDEHSGAVITTDKQGLQAYKETRAVKLARLKQQNSIVERQDKIERDVAEIKELLLELVGRK